MAKADVHARCAAYLKEQPGTGRILAGLRGKYESLGKVAGNYVLKQPTKEERQFLRGLFRKDYSEAKQVSISLQRFEAAFDGTVYEGIRLEEVLGAYFKEEILPKKAQQERAAREKTVFWQEVLKRTVNGCFTAWLREEVRDGNGRNGLWLNRLYEADAGELAVLVGRMDRLASLLEEERGYWARPVLAALATKDPHALDDGTVLYRLMLAYLSGLEGEPFPERAYEKARLLERYGIIADGSHLSVDTYGLEAIDGGGQPLGWGAFHSRKEPLVLTRGNLGDAAAIRPLGGGPVFAFENPAVFYTFIQQVPESCAICTSGQVNRTALQLLGILEQGGVPVLYNGDYDPEGLAIAQRLCRSFSCVSPWHYSGEAYRACLSDQPISDRRLAQLQGIRHPGLSEAAEAIRERRLAGYQEYLVEDLVAQGKALLGGRAEQAEQAGQAGHAGGLTPLQFDRKKGEEGIF